MQIEDQRDQRVEVEKGNAYSDLSDGLEELERMYEIEKATRYLNIPTIIRLILSVGLVYMVYREAGPWTGIFSFLTLSYIEMQTCYNQFRLRKQAIEEDRMQTMRNKLREDFPSCLKDMTSNTTGKR